MPLRHGLKFDFLIADALVVRAHPDVQGNPLMSFRVHGNYVPVQHDVSCTIIVCFRSIKKGPVQVLICRAFSGSEREGFWNSLDKLLAGNVMSGVSASSAKRGWLRSTRLPALGSPRHRRIHGSAVPLGLVRHFTKVLLWRLPYPIHLSCISNPLTPW